MQKDQRLEKGKETREKILMAALSIISEEGIKNLSANKIAQKASISKSNVFHHFSSIGEIPSHVLEMLSGLLLEPLEDIGYEDFNGYLVKLGESMFHATDEQIKFYRAFFSFYNEVAYNEEYRPMFQNCQKMFTSHIEKVIRSSNIDLSEESLIRLANMVAINVDGFGIHFMINRDPDFYDSLWKIQSSMISEWVQKNRIHK